MKEKKPLPIANESALSGSFDELALKIVQFFEGNKKILIGAACTLLLLVIALLIYLSSSERASFDDTLKVKSLYSRYLNATPEESAAPYKELSELLKRNPDLSKIYAPLIAQSKLIKGEKVDLFPFIDHLTSLPSFARFSEISALIESASYKEALEKSQALKESLEDKNSPLYAANLIRIASLGYVLQDNATERAALLELLEDPSKLLKETKRGMLSYEEYFKWRLQEIGS